MSEINNVDNARNGEQLIIGSTADYMVHSKLV